MVILSFTLIFLKENKNISYYLNLVKDGADTIKNNLFKLLYKNKK